MAKKREPETARIDAVTHDGRGIAAVTGKKVFVAGALPGEVVRFNRRKRRRNYDEAELVEVLEPSPSRIEPRCAVYGVCGGCSLQHVSAHEQRAIKERSLRDNMQRIGRAEPDTWLPPLFDASDDGGWRYRRRARLAVKDVPAKGRVLVGFRERHAPYITNMHRCEILAAPVDALIDPLSEMISKLGIRSRLPQIEVAVADNCTELVFRVLDAPSDADRAVLIDFAEQHGLQIALQPGGPDSVVSLHQSPPESLTYDIPESRLQMEFAATDFVQINATVNRLMVGKAIELLQPRSSDDILDLYCGIGNFSLPLARHASQVLGIEGEQQQVSRAQQNARRNGIDNCRFSVGDLSAVNGGEAWMARTWDKMLLDPARSGAIELLQHVERIAPARIVYVSCHPGTLARDTEELVYRRGYRLEAAGIIDMFPHTAHVESIAVFSKV
ncbi:MAG: 23S rRNA (uracil(1939)-C(5))-methyltransferase RlmD [Gammaproteobacteria bacterium]|nr:23S rRNA (uracil(1939)-C(5))-methyltransferase RlmD [Gammaproteobacteria bacterium]MDH4313518.1 23S rRNA (uracil(1939)-C(5))-methyltransferase RlmD [Gammaproteobacteria bacterium]MDH5212587.1 23S rRNA (uracil(1939)-C(5))-methyltransferase RlmD [Gammaproteobacteria bacterium]